MLDPANVLRSFLDELSMSEAELARQAHVPVKRLRQILNGEIPMTRKIGRRIGRVFGSPPDYWIHLRQIHEFRRAAQERRARKADRTPYPPEFRRKLVALARDGRDLRELAFEYECSDTSIRRWMRDAERDDEAGDGGNDAPHKQPGLFDGV